MANNDLQSSPWFPSLFHSIQSPLSMAKHLGRVQRVSESPPRPAGRQPCSMSPISIADPSRVPPGRRRPGRAPTRSCDRHTDGSRTTRSSAFLTTLNTTILRHSASSSVMARSRSISDPSGVTRAICSSLSSTWPYCAEPWTSDGTAIGSRTPAEVVSGG